jgi:hypothetical protein
MSKIDTPRTPPASQPAQFQNGALQLEGAITERFFATSLQMAEMTATLAQEMVDFTGRRMRAQLDFMGSAPNWSDPQDVMAAQFRFVADASKAYAEEIDHLTHVLRRMNGMAEADRPRAA